MTNLYISWVVSAVVLIAAAVWIGKVARNKAFGIFVDDRGRFSLSQFQVVLWTIVVLSLIMGTFFARWLSGVNNPLSFTIPNEILIVMGISIGSTATAGAIKASKDLKPVTIKGKDNPKFSQIFLTEEGSGTSDTIDVTKFQNFWLTLIVIIAYILTVITAIAKTGVSGTDFALPSIGGTMLALLGISHAGYIAGKLPDKK